MGIYTSIRPKKWNKEQSDLFLKLTDLYDVELEDEYDDLAGEGDCIADDITLNSEYGDWLIDLSKLPKGTTHIHISRG